MAEIFLLREEITAINCRLDFRPARIQIAKVREPKMKSGRLTVAVVLGLALMGTGCASLRPAASYFDPSMQDAAPVQPNHAGEYANNDPDFAFWEMLYWTLYETGQFLANR